MKKISGFPYKTLHSQIKTTPKSFQFSMVILREITSRTI